jgi:hypothetical protein
MVADLDEDFRKAPLFLHLIQKLISAFVRRSISGLLFTRTVPPTRRPQAI